MILSKISSVAAAFIGLVSLQASSVTAYDASRSDNLVVYYGQNSWGVSNPDQSTWQKNLGFYCQDNTINAFPLAFVHVFFSVGGLPELNMANTCSSNGAVFPGTNLANCQFLAADIKACQAKGKLVTLSLGGATGAASFSSESQALQFAQTVWNLFLGGSSSTRPFGDAVLDGVDLDIEGGSGAYFASFANRIKSLSNGAPKKYYLTAAPQCPFPDAYLGATINAVPFDAIYVQVFYNNWCGLQNYNNPNAWNFREWDNWAKTVSPNRNVKIFIGAPASPSAAGGGYVDAATLGNIAKQTRSQYSSFGGVMLWDASQAYGNNRFDVAIKNALGGGGGGGGTTSPTTRPTTTPTTTPTATPTTPGNGSCAGVAPWSSSVAYNGGAYVTYNGRLWTNSWWSQADVPGGPAGVWVDKGACRGRFAPTTDAGLAILASPSPLKVRPAATLITKAAATEAATNVRRSSRFGLGKN